MVLGNRVRIPAALACLLLACAAGTAADAATLTPQEQKLVPLAKAEGAVTIINPLFSDETAQRLGAAFIKYYNLGPDFKFNNLRKGTGQTVAQVRQEIKAGRFTVDVHLVSAPGFFDEAARRGAFEKLDSGHWKNHLKLIKKAGQYSNYPYAVVPFAYTFQPVWNASCPGMASFKADSYADVLQASLKGKTISPDITKSFTYTNTVISLMEAGAVDVKSLWEKLKATDPIVEFRTEPKMQMVMTCQRPFDMWNLSGRVYQNVLKKADLAKVLKIGSYKEGQVMLGHADVERRRHQDPVAGPLAGLVGDDLGTQPVGAQEACRAVLLVRADRHHHRLAGLQALFDLGPGGEGEQHGKTPGNVAPVYRQTAVATP